MVALKPKDHVIMVDCYEAERHEGEVWAVASNPWQLCGKEVVMLEGFSGSFATEFLRLTDKELHRHPMPLNKEFIAYEKMFRAVQQITREEFITAVTNFFGGNDRDYAEGCWNQFCQSPIGYIFSRNPMEQGEMLFKMAKQKAQTEDIHKLCFSVHESYYRRFKEVVTQ